MSIIDFTDEKDKREMDSDCKVIMADGAWYKFSAEYEVERCDTSGETIPPEVYAMLHSPMPPMPPTMTIEFFARDMKHAEKLIEQMRSGLKFVGKIYREIPA